MATTTLPITLLDGGMGRQLLRMGAPFGQPEWSALALAQAPDLIRQAHEEFARAGSRVITTCNYAVVPFHLGPARFQREGTMLSDRAGRLAREAAARCEVLVAGSLPPLFGSYRPDLFLPEQARKLLPLMVEGLAPHVDLWLAETLASTSEAQIIGDILAEDGRPLWLAFTLMDDDDKLHATPVLRSGEPVANTVQVARAVGAAALLFNCCRPEVVEQAIIQVKKALLPGESLAIGAYANAFPAQRRDAAANVELQKIRDDLTPGAYLDFARIWHRLGATIIGGCCGIGPEHITLLAQALLPGTDVMPTPKG